MVSGFGFLVSGFWSRFPDSGFQVLVFRFRVPKFDFRNSVSGFRVSDFGLRGGLQPAGENCEEAFVEVHDGEVAPLVLVHLREKSELDL